MAGEVVLVLDPLANPTGFVDRGEVVVDDAGAEAFVGSVAALSPPDADRLLICFEAMQQVHPHEECWYLNLLGVVPERQGTGVGTALLRATLPTCDRTGAPAYLEATSSENRRLYERQGFEVVGEISLPDGPSLWPMWREPRP